MNCKKNNSSTDFVVHFAFYGAFYMFLKSVFKNSVSFIHEWWMVSFFFFLL